jgi:hypothetical protein
MDLQVEAFAQHRRDVAEFNNRVTEWKEKDKDERGGKPEPPEEPPSFITKDITIESLGELLADNPHGMLCGRDELDAWFKSFTRYRKGGGNDRSQWLELHGATTLRIDRLTRERQTLIVPRAGVSICGTIQPSVFASALDKESLDAGLGARILLCAPPERKRVWTEAEVTEELAEEYAGLLEKLLALPLKDPAKRRPHVIGMSPGAKQLWIEFYNEWGEVQLQSEGAQRSAFSKLEAYCLRLALVHHVVSCVSRGADHLCQVTKESFAAAIGLVRWFAQESRRIYCTLSEKPEETETRRLVEWIAGRGGEVTAVHLRRANASRYPTTESAEAALDSLVQAELACWEACPPSDKGGRPTRKCILQPHTLCSETDETDETLTGRVGDAEAPYYETSDRPSAPLENYRNDEVSSVSSVSEFRSKPSGVSGVAKAVSSQQEVSSQGGWIAPDSNGSAPRTPWEDKEGF